jgi:hypothetical protein
MQDNDIDVHQWVASGNILGALLERWQRWLIAEVPFHADWAARVAHRRTVTDMWKLLEKML